MRRFHIFILLILAVSCIAAWTLVFVLHTSRSKPLTALQPLAYREHIGQIMGIDKRRVYWIHDKLTTSVWPRRTCRT